MIAQLIALKHPARVASLTAISSSPFGEGVGRRR
jgi:pimeloyl-ACP methyl ester carboxylesterase